MSYVTNTLSNLIHQTAFFNLTWGNYLMIAVACVFLYLAIKHGFEPLLLVPIAFGMLLVNIYPDIMLSIEDSSNGVGGLLHYFYLLDEWSILPSLIFLGVGAMTDFGPLIANPISFLMGAAAQLGIYLAYFLAIFLGFNGKAAAAISIIGGADGPTSIFLAGKLGQSSLMGPIAVAAYSYMSLVPIIQPPIMKAFTTEKERKIKMAQLRPVTKLEKILFPIVITIVVCLIQAFSLRNQALQQVPTPDRRSAWRRSQGDPGLPAAAAGSGGLSGQLCRSGQPGRQRPTDVRDRRQGVSRFHPGQRGASCALLSRGCQNRFWR